MLVSDKLTGGQGSFTSSLVLLVALPGLGYLWDPVPVDACVRLLLVLFTLVLRFKSG